MRLPEVSTYRFVSETIANLALTELTQALAGNMKFKDNKALYPALRIDNGAPANILVVIPVGTPVIQNLMAAQTLAALLLRAMGVELPEKALGDAISQLEMQAALYELMQILPVAWVPLVQQALQAAGIHAPDSLAGILTGAIAEEVKGMTRKKIVDALIDSLTEIKASYDAAEADNILTQDEMKALGIKLVGLLVPKLFS